mmetsp:Transcript_12418/g.9022  ORF Transcript_12418/g.9022 Transcript_12418/m.9022 type:complete len:118 (+) Transcript_12418:580-933(+)
MKNKHAKGPGMSNSCAVIRVVDGMALLTMNSGRGRGRPKKNASGYRFSHIDPTSDEFFKTQDKSGGPIDPSLGFKEVYTEIYIKRAKPPKDEGTLDKEENIEMKGENETEERKQEES